MNDQFNDYKQDLPSYVVDEVSFALYKMRHSAEHILTMAMLRLFGKDSLHMAMGPATDEGFYFDFDPKDLQINEEDFSKIEEEMAKIIAENIPFVREDISVEDAKALFAGNPYKLEWIEEKSQDGGSLSIYRSGDFTDLCKGPHIDSTGEIKAFKLLSIAGAYWRGDEKNKMLTRIYGTAFSTQEELDKHLELIEEAKKRDHRRLIKDLDLVVFSDLVGAGLPMYTPRGNILREAIYDYSRELNNEIGYDEVHTPNFNRGELFKVSGHYDKYKDDMLRVSSQYSDEEMFIKPMNCPQHTQLFASRTRSYKDLPIRYADFANLARDERPGEMHGMLRTRVFAQDDGHAFVREDQIADEFKNVLGVVLKALKTYDLKYWIRLSLRDPQKPEKYLGDDSVWDKAESKLREMLIGMNVDFKEAPGEAAIYGPKMDFMAEDSLGREWQISTIQIDMNMPGRFGLKYIDEQGKEQTPIMIHRAIIGSERFIGIIIEHFGGSFPAWMSPEQVRIIPISEENNGYAGEILSRLKKVGVHATVDTDNDRMQNKIRKAQEMKVPYMLILGKREAEAGQVSVRLRSGEAMNGISYEEFESKLITNIKERKLEIAL